MFNVFAGTLFLTVIALVLAVIRVKPWKNLKSTDYIYVVNSQIKTIVELDRETGIKYCKAMKLIYCDHLPYEDYGYDNPYDFINEWTFYDVDMNFIKYDENFNEVYLNNV